jgi:hypothetical protein
MSDFMKMCPVGGELLHADGRTDRQTHGEASIHFSQFSKRI